MNRYWKVIAGMLTISIIFNIYMFYRITSADRAVDGMLRRIRYMEDNLDTRVANVIEDMDYMNFRAQSVVEELRWDIGDGLANSEMTVPLSIQFKLKNIDPGANVYVSLEMDGEEPKLIPASLSNETTFRVSEVVSIFSDIQADLVVEKYGIKQVETLFRAEEIYRKFSGDVTSYVHNLSYDFDVEDGELRLNLDVFSEYIQNPNKRAPIRRAEVVFIRNGIALDRYPMERKRMDGEEELIQYEGIAIQEAMRLTQLDSMEVAVILEDEQGFVYETKVLRVHMSGDVPQLLQPDSPKLLVRK